LIAVLLLCAAKQPAQLVRSVFVADSIDGMGRV
jgi:hypothetical protein